MDDGKEEAQPGVGSAGSSRQPLVYVLIQSGALANGGISSISHIIAGLRNHRAIIVTDLDTAYVQEWRAQGIKTHVMCQSASAGLIHNPLGVLRSYWRYTRELLHIIRSSGAKVIHANDPLALQLSIAAAKLTGAKLVFNIRGTFDPEDLPSRMKYRLLFAAADHMLYLSDDMARRWSEHVPNAISSYSVTYSAVDPARFRAPSIDRDDRPIALVSGLVRPLKGQLEFIKHVVPVLASEGVGVWFAGDFDPSRDGYMAACAEAAAPFGDAVRFLGYRADIAELMGKSTVIAVTSRHEGLVRAMIEGMSCARPVVSFDVCSARELLEDKAEGAGTVVPSGDFAAMADAILRYCRDPELAAGAGEKGRAATIRLLTPQEIVRRHEGVYGTLSSA